MNKKGDRLIIMKYFQSISAIQRGKDGEQKNGPFLRHEGGGL